MIPAGDNLDLTSDFDIPSSFHLELCQREILLTKESESDLKLGHAVLQGSARAMSGNAGSGHPYRARASPLKAPPAGVGGGGFGGVGGGYDPTRASPVEKPGSNTVLPSIKPARGPAAGANNQQQNRRVSEFL